MDIERQIRRNYWEIIGNYNLKLANEGVIRRDVVSGALDHYFARLDDDLPLCLKFAKPNDPPPANWRTYWRQMVRR